MSDLFSDGSKIVAVKRKVKAQGERVGDIRLNALPFNDAAVYYSNILKKDILASSKAKTLIGEQF